MTGLCLALFFFGAATGLVNVAANALGVSVEARAGRPLLSGLHAGFSFGGLGGALVGGIAASVLGVTAHLALVAVAGLFLTAWMLPVLMAAGRRIPRRLPRTPTARHGAGRPPCWWCSARSRAAPRSARAR